MISSACSTLLHIIIPLCTFSIDAGHNKASTSKHCVHCVCARLTSCLHKFQFVYYLISYEYWAHFLCTCRQHTLAFPLQCGCAGVCVVEGVSVRADNEIYGNATRNSNNLTIGRAPNRICYKFALFNMQKSCKVFLRSTQAFCRARSAVRQQQRIVRAPCGRVCHIRIDVLSILLLFQLHCIVRQSM